MPCLHHDLMLGNIQLTKQAKICLAPLFRHDTMHFHLPVLDTFVLRCACYNKYDAQFTSCFDAWPDSNRVTCVHLNLPASSHTFQHHTSMSGGSSHHVWTTHLPPYCTWAPFATPGSPESCRERRNPLGKRVGFFSRVSPRFDAFRPLSDGPAPFGTQRSSEAATARVRARERCCEPCSGWIPAQSVPLGAGCAADSASDRFWSAHLWLRKKSVEEASETLPASKQLCHFKSCCHLDHVQS